MSIIEAIILGIIQGLTEFLPISSSAHLVITPFLFGWQIPVEEAFIFGVLVQLGTLVAVIAYFWKDLLTIALAFFEGIARRQPFANQQSALGWYLILATLPAGVLGLLFKDTLENLFSDARAAAFFLFLTAFLLLFSEYIGKRSRKLDEFNWVDSLWMGMGQALAIFPGVSRSGATIASGMARQLDRPSAARFSFLMSVPIMLAAGGLATLDLFEVPNLGQFLPVIFAGFFTSAIVGYLSIRWLLAYLVRHSLVAFAIYCLVLAAVTILLSYIR
jgi:undecaprenyl-diphosphatase